MKYKNKSELKLVLPGIGEVEPGETIETDKIIENSNFEEVKSGYTKDKKK